MSQSASNNDKSTAVIEDRSTKDIFESLNEGDELDSLDLTTPIKKADKKQAKPEGDDKDVKEEEDTTDSTEGDSDSDDEEEVDDELSELEEELEEVDEDKLELDASPIRRREILKEYPDFFKKFPAVEKSIYREREFTKIFPTVKDAEQAHKDAEVLQNFGSDMIENGNVKNVLKMIKDSNPETFANVADSYLEHLAEVDEKAYNHVIGNVIKEAIIGMVKEAKASGDDDFRIAAGLLNKYVFGSSTFTPPQKLGKPKSEKSEDKVSQREKEFEQRQTETIRTNIDTRVKNSIRAAVDKNIDPKGSMTAYIKSTATEKAVAKITSLMDKDPRFTRLNDKLMEELVKSNFSPDIQEKIKKLYLGRAQSLLVPVLKSIRNEALRGMDKKIKETDETDIENENGNKPERQRSQNSERRLSSDSNKAKLDSLKGKSSLEALNELMGDR